MQALDDGSTTSVTNSDGSVTTTVTNADGSTVTTTSAASASAASAATSSYNFIDQLVQRLAMIAQTGMARAIYPVHAPLDGDVVFAAATGAKPIDPLFGLTELGMHAANTVARAIARGVYAATALPFPGALPSWQDRFG